MTEDEPDAAGALALDEDQDEAMEEMSLEERQGEPEKSSLERVSLPWRCRFALPVCVVPDAVFGRLRRLQQLR